MPPLTITFCGTPEFACPSLQALHEDPAFDVVQVITQPDKPVGRKRVVTAPAVKVLAEKLGLPVAQPEDINEDTKHKTQDTRPDFLVVVAYGQKMSSETLNLPRIAPVNLHFSLLPLLRGASPAQNSILAGEKETGITVFRMVDDIDAGPVFAQKKVNIDQRETKDSLLSKCALIGAALLVETLKKPLKETPQDDSKATFCKKLTRSVGQVDPSSMTAEEIDRYVRALVPWPGVRTSIKGNDVKLIEASLTPHADSFELPCAKGSILYITKIQSSGKNVMTGEEWGRGHLC
jgi:methionyl-tRNA formyltransferase